MKIVKEGGFSMCGRYFFDLEASYATLRKLNITKEQLSLFEFSKNEVFPSQQALVFIEEKEEKQLVLDVKKWGIEGFHGNLLINARYETIHQKPTFNRIMHKRCIIIASGFYEWVKNGNKKDKIYIQKDDHEMMFMAAIFNERNEFVILTDQSQNTMADIHDRTPLLLNLEEMKQWLHYGHRLEVDNENLSFMKI